MKPQQADARYELTILSYPNESTINQVCELIYQTRDRNLLASLSSLPYLVGRSFSNRESVRIHDDLKSLGVYHRLLSKEEGAPAYVFEAPPIKSQPSTSKTKQAQILSFPTSSRPAKSSRRVLIVSLIVASMAAGVALYSLQDFSSSNRPPLPTPQTDFDAKVGQIVNRVEYRLGEDLIWKTATRGTLLNSRDSIRTYEESTAQINYRNGTFVLVRPNTLLVLGQSPEPTSELIQLSNGSLNARMKASAEPKKLQIQTPSGTLEVSSPLMNETAPREARVETSLKDGTLRVAVTSGSATLIPSKADLKPVSLGAMQEVSARADQISAPQIFKPEIRLLGPKPGSVIKIDPKNSSSVLFQWEALDPDMTYTLEVATDSEMKNILVTQESIRASLEFNYLDLGTVYWRVKSRYEDLVYSSPVWQLHVQKSNQ